jgi:hypothetical protein
MLCPALDLCRWMGRSYLLVVEQTAWAGKAGPGLSSSSRRKSVWLFSLQVVISLSSGKPPSHYIVKANHSSQKGELTEASIETIMADLPLILAKE